MKPPSRVRIPPSPPSFDPRTPGRRSAVRGIGEAPDIPVVIHELIATDVAVDKLGARAIDILDAERTLWNEHIVVANRRGHADRPQGDVRRLLIGRDGSGRALTLVIEPTAEPTTWMLITGWASTDAERRLLP